MTLILASAAVSIVPPARVGAWVRPESPQVIAPADIFAYMDGAGEMYLAYRLVRLEAYEYRAESSPSGSDRVPGVQEDPILLELYQLESSDDAYGLLSGDWGGEPVALDGVSATTPARALYGAGLLRAWSADLYLRVLATTETAASRAAALELARAVVAGRPSPPPPGLVTALPETVAGSFRLRPDSVSFLRSHLVLNSIYFLGTANLLGLSAATEAVAARYAQVASEGGGRLRLFVVRYPTEAAALEALAQFRSGYLQGPRAAGGGDEAAIPSATASAATGVVRVEDGWMGYRIAGRRLVLVFEAPDAATTRAVLEQAGP
jgi:hypothetical protein